MKESKKDVVGFAIAAQLIVSIALGFYNIFLGIIGVVIFVILIIYYTKNTNMDEIKIDKAIDEIYSDLDKINQERMYEMPIAMAIVDNEGMIYWYNQAFGKAFKKEK
ncbi:MAG: phosphoesterase, partial [Acetobacterium sp.]|nr:phosphoesterase [Acetobacterium sp.]